MSHELYKSIHSGISELDNDISMNSEPSILIESSNDGALKVQKEVDGNVFQKSDQHLDRDSLNHDDTDVFAMEATPAKSKEPFVIKSPFCDSERVSFADVDDELVFSCKNEGTEEGAGKPLELFQAIHGLELQDSVTIDDFKKLKNGKFIEMMDSHSKEVDSVLAETTSDQPFNLLDEEFQSAGKRVFWDD